MLEVTFDGVGGGIYIQTHTDAYTYQCKIIKPTPVPEPTNTTINQEALVRLFDFKYLGGTICNNASLDSELRYRVGNASATFGKLQDSKTFD